MQSSQATSLPSKRQDLSVAQLSGRTRSSQDAGSVFWPLILPLCSIRMIVWVSERSSARPTSARCSRQFQIKMGDTVLVAPWDFQPERGDIMFRYTQGQVESLRRSGQLKV